jgi:hypothetical protein
MNFALSMEPVFRSVNPVLNRTSRIVSLNRKKAVNRSHEALHKAHAVTIGQAQLSLWTMLSTIIPDDAYDWEGDMFENEFSPSEREGLSALLRKGSLGEGGE